MESGPDGGHRGLLVGCACASLCSWLNKVLQRKGQCGRYPVILSRVDIVFHHRKRRAKDVTLGFDFLLDSMEAQGIVSKLYWRSTL